jgi:hypothetical protein
MAEQTAQQADPWAAVIERSANLPDLSGAPAVAPMAVGENGAVASEELTTSEGAEPEAPPEGAPVAEPPEAPADEGETEEDAEKPSGRERRVQRFSELTHQRDLAREERDYWRSRALGETQGPPSPPTGAPDGAPEGLLRNAEGRPLRPLEEQYGTTAEYNAAMMLYEDALEDFRDLQRQRVQEARTTRLTALERVKQTYPDYEPTVTEWTRRVNMTRDCQAALQAAPDVYGVCYYLATHPEESQRITALQGEAAFYAIGGLMERLRQTAPPEGGPPGPAEPVRQAPPVAAPITPVRGLSGRAGQTLDDMPLEQFFQVRDKEVRERRWR